MWLDVCYSAPAEGGKAPIYLPGTLVANARLHADTLAARGVRGALAGAPPRRTPCVLRCLIQHYHVPVRAHFTFCKRCTVFPTTAYPAATATWRRI